jgi:hypothetical protein
MAVKYDFIRFCVVNIAKNKPTDFGGTDTWLKMVLPPLQSGEIAVN